MRERPHVPGQREPLLLFLPHEVMAQGIDHCVDRLVGERLALVDPAEQDVDLAAPELLVDELLHERRLAHPRESADAHRDRVPGPRGRQRFAQCALLGLAPDDPERKRTVAGWRARHRQRAACRAQDTEDFPAGGPLHRVDAQEGAA